MGIKASIEPRRSRPSADTGLGALPPLPGPKGRSTAAAGADEAPIKAGLPGLPGLPALPAQSSDDSGTQSPRATAETIRRRATLRVRRAGGDESAGNSTGHRIDEVHAARAGLPPLTGSASEMISPKAKTACLWTTFKAPDARSPEITIRSAGSAAPGAPYDPDTERSPSNKVVLPQPPGWQSRGARNLAALATARPANAGNVLQAATVLSVAADQELRFAALQTDPRQLLRATATLVTRGQPTERTSPSERRVLGTVGAVLQMYSPGEISDLLLECDRHEREILVRGLIEGGGDRR